MANRKRIKLVISERRHKTITLFLTPNEMQEYLQTDVFDRKQFIEDKLENYDRYKVQKEEVKNILLFNESLTEKKFNKIEQRRKDNIRRIEEQRRNNSFVWGVI